MMKFIIDLKAEEKSGHRKKLAIYRIQYVDKKSKHNMQGHNARRRMITAGQTGLKISHICAQKQKFED